MILSRSPGHLGPSVGGLGGGDILEGERQGVQGASRSAASLEPPWSLPGPSLPLSELRERAGTFTLCFLVSYITIVCRGRRGRGGRRGT